ncbi:hypothetical protein EKO27_g9028 [Xylaria grammica]|uniref:F-box domain-containing protein n=1 Tax=Xylaria grammica TaxID=363999 RepID=A0A439CVB9_9PEZI|nr:hypothetical protein EKO27_g9028 [Xylaria grammica]
MPLITDLPCEVITSVLRKLDNIQFLLPALLACRYFYLSYKENPSSVVLDILRQQIGPDLIPYAVAASEVLRLPRPRTRSSVKQLLDVLYNDPGSLVPQIQVVPLGTVIEMGHTHDLIEGFADAFASEAWALFGQSERLLLSAAERFRFHRAFYRVELFLRIFRGRGSRMAGQLESEQLELFLSRHSPWLNEQLGCVHDYLEKRFSKATLDVVSHDIEFGMLSVDYVSNGPLNHFKQLWLSQGIEFLSRVESEKSHEGQQTFLNSAFGGSQVGLHDALTKPYDTEIDDIRPLEDYSAEEQRALDPREDKEDVDMGPSCVWRALHDRLPRPEWVLCHAHARLRHRAYVLWDYKRVERHQMLSSFVELRDSPGESDDEYFKAFEEMHESFRKRSKIWLGGGRGYWDKGA